jgi:methylthioribose-1-phosphate isomerase
VSAVRRSASIGDADRRAVPDPIPPTIEWRRGRIRLIDQRALPTRLLFVECETVAEVCDAIQSMVVRGAPALGATGAYGVALAARLARGKAGVRAAAARISATRPTAVNLGWGVGRALDAYELAGPEGALAEAHRIAIADVEANRAIGRYGAELLDDGSRVMTHCNAGSLACVGYGTALGVIRAAAEAGKRLRVWVGETRPVLQGARLTAWELDRLGIEATLVADSMAGSLMRGGEVDAVVVGADRIAANGDVANKIGTYSLAVLAAHHHVPFFVAAPTSTVDLSTADGTGIEVEERDGDEVRRMGGTRIVPTRIAALNRAFDVTPARLVRGIVTECGVARSPYRRSLAHLVRAAGEHS